ncbi:MAG: prephenate dehydratase [Myxococcota bacterium]
MSHSPTDPPHDLQTLRELIERLDRQIMGLFKERMNLVEAVAETKIEAASPFRDQMREEQVLGRVRRAAVEMGLDAHQMEEIYRQIMAMSVAHQLAHLKRTSRAPLRVAYQGVEGSYSHLTAQRHYRGRSGGVLLEGHTSFRAAVTSIRDGSSDLALLPIENSTAGSINETYDLLAEDRITINAEVISRVSHCLLGLPGTDPAQLRAVLSHPQALMQCAAFFQRMPWVKAQAEFDTAGAARKVKEAGDPTLAAIASESAARVFGLDILERDIQTQAGNYTRFVEVALTAASPPPDQPCKTSLMLITDHQPGSLSEILREFSSRTVNLSKLESRPMPDQPFSYRFYLDIEGHALSANVASALKAAATRTRELRVLGTYPRALAPDPEPSVTPPAKPGEPS